MKHVVRIYGPYDGFGGHIAAMVVWGVLLAVLIVAVILIARMLIRRPVGPFAGPGPGAWGAAPGPHQALAELDLRYARGEIERSDYLQRRADLLGQPSPVAGSPAPGPAPGGGSGSPPVKG